MLMLNIEGAQLAGWFGGYEIILIIVVIILLFGGKKIPELMRGIGKGVKEFKGGISGDEGEEKKEGDKESKSDKK